MNNTAITTLAIASVLMAATLVVGITLATTTITPTTAFSDKKDDGKGNGNTVTAQKDKRYEIVSGFDNSLEQEAQNVICTHPGDNASCSQEGVITPTPTPTPTPSNCNGAEDETGRIDEDKEQIFGDPDTPQPLRHSLPSR